MPSNSGVNRNDPDWSGPIFICLFRMKIAFFPPREAGHLLQGLKNSNGSQGAQIPVCELLMSPWLAPLCVCVKNAKFGFIKGRKKGRNKKIPKCPEPKCDIRSLEATFIMLLMWFPSSPWPVCCSTLDLDDVFTRST